MGLSVDGRRAVVEGFELGLGRSRIDGVPNSLVDFANSQNVKIYNVYKAEGGINMFDAPWPGSDAKLAENLLFIMNRANGIKFNLNGVVNSVDELPNVVLMGQKGLGHQPVVNGVQIMGNTTNWEISQVLTNPELSKKATFFLNGQQVKVP